MGTDRETDIGGAEVYRPEDVHTRYMKLSGGLGPEARPVWVKVHRRRGLAGLLHGVEKPYRRGVPALVKSLDSAEAMTQAGQHEEITIIKAAYADGQKISIDTREMVWEFCHRPVHSEYVEEE